MPSSRERPSWDEFFLGQLPALAARTTCDRGRSAAIFVRSNDQLAAGYVGSPPGMDHCDDVGHLWDETGTHCLRTIHAEQNAMIRALRNGVSLRDTTVYCTMEPCFTCAKMMVGVGVFRVVCGNRYHDAAHTRKLFIDADVLLIVREQTELYAPSSSAADFDMMCPEHNLLLEMFEKRPNGALMCPRGEVWRRDPAIGLVAVGSMEWGEMEKHA